jgi:F-type H+-transporting ATPase subunit epsilon
MRLRITTPLATMVDEDGIVGLRAEDDSGSFGILPGHADFLTTLAVSVVSWTGADGAARHCAVRRGVFMVDRGRDISIATREAIPGNDLATLDTVVLQRFRDDLEIQRTEHTAGARLQLDAVRQLMRHLRPQGARGRGSFG